jgi:hypothetical protein
MVPKLFVELGVDVARLDELAQPLAEGMEE